MIHIKDLNIVASFGTKCYITVRHFLDLLWGSRFLTSFLHFAAFWFLFISVCYKKWTWSKTTMWYGLKLWIGMDKLWSLFKLQLQKRVTYVPMVLWILKKGYAIPDQATVAIALACASEGVVFKAMSQIVHRYFFGLLDKITWLSLLSLTQKSGFSVKLLIREMKRKKCILVHSMTNIQVVQ